MVSLSFDVLSPVVTSIVAFFSPHITFTFPPPDNPSKFEFDLVIRP